MTDSPIEPTRGATTGLPVAMASRIETGLASILRRQHEHVERRQQLGNVGARAQKVDGLAKLEFRRQPFQLGPLGPVADDQELRRGNCVAHAGRPLAKTARGSFPAAAPPRCRPPERWAAGPTSAAPPRCPRDG